MGLLLGPLFEAASTLAEAVLMLERPQDTTWGRKYN